MQVEKPGPSNRSDKKGALLRVLTLVFCCAQLCAFSIDSHSATYSIRDYGAKGDGQTSDTAAIQAAIEACANAGGGTVLFPPGRFLSGTIFLRSHVTLEFDTGSTLLGGTRLEDYPLTLCAFASYTDRYCGRALIWGEGLEDVGIVGRGTIDGQGAVFKDNRPSDEVAAEIAKDWTDPSRHVPKGVYINRPYLIRLVSCSGVRVERITLRDSAMWMQHYLNCDFVTIRGVTVYNHCAANNDMMDIDCCREVLISDCFGDTDDDALTLNGAVSGGGLVDLNAGGLFDNNASITSTGGSIDIDAVAAVTIDAALVAAASGSVSVTSTSSSITTAATTGTLSAGTTVTLDAGTSATVNANVTSGSGVSIEGDGSVTVNSPAILNGGTGNVTIYANKNNGPADADLLTIAEGTTLTAAGSILLNSGNGSGTGSDASIGGTLTSTAGIITVVSDDDLTLNATILNVGASGTATFTANDSVTISTNDAVNMNTGGNLVINSNNVGTDAAIFSMSAGSAITGSAALIDINLGASTGTNVLRGITTGTDGVVDIDHTGSGTVQLASGVISASGTGAVSITSTGGALDIDGAINAGTGTIDLDGVTSLALDEASSLTALDIGANAIHLATSGAASTLTLGGSLTTGDGGTITVDSTNDVTINNTTVTTGTGQLLVIGDGDVAFGTSKTLNMVSANLLQIDANAAGGTSAETLSMAAGSSITGAAALVDINVQSSTGTATLRSIIGGTVDVTGTGTGTISLASGTLESTSGGVTIVGDAAISTAGIIDSAATATLTSGTTMTLGGSLTADDKVDLNVGTTFDNNAALESRDADVEITAGGAVANIDGTITAQTNVTIQSSSSVTVNQAITASDGQVVITASGDITTATAGDITAKTLVQIIGDNAVTLNGDVDAVDTASGKIIIRANQDGNGAQSLTLRGDLHAGSNLADAIELTVNLLGTSPNNAGVKFEVEPNGLVYSASGTSLSAAAQNVDDPTKWSTASNPNIQDSTIVPHATVNALGNGKLHVYSFTAGAGETGVFDLDGAWGGTSYDAELFLFDAAGNLIASNDDRGTFDPGSTMNGGTNQDSFITHSFTATGTYYLVVGEWDTIASNGQISGNSADVGDNYSLHLSITGHAATGVALDDITASHSVYLPIDFSLNPGGVQNLDGSNWALSNNPNIELSTSVEHTSVLGGGVNGQFAGDSIDVYSFTTSAIPGTVVIDIDSNTFDTEIFLYTANGTLIASSDNESADTGDGVAGASRISTGALAASTTYYVVVQSKAATGPGLVGGENYTLNLSVPDHAVVGGGQGTITIGNTTDGNAITVSTGTNGGVTLSSRSDAGANAANITFDGVTFSTGGGIITVDSNDSITINDGDAAGVASTNTVSVIGGGALIFNANLDDSGANAFVMTSDVNNGDATIVSDGDVTINVGTTTGGTSILADIDADGALIVDQAGGELNVDALAGITVGSVDFSNTGGIS
ncbi:MAG: pre-peptidase C-terminal domain-containing protein, partial [Candidatus Omnitrophica bacterium]|nr:pre-peptidase C-terminal domain-containing protein [Candidatus Omnitrophota bacterium]